MEAAVPIALFVIVLFLMPWVFQYLWNSTVPEIFGLPAIRFWQAFRLLLIAGMLFGAGGYFHQIK